MKTEEFEKLQSVFNAVKSKRINADKIEIKDHNNYLSIEFIYFKEIENEKQN